MGKLYLVRHADAGHRKDHDGPDIGRPLSERGQRQADALVDLLGDAGITRLLSSPYLRCMQTLVPLGHRLGLPIEDEPLLAEGAGAAGALDLAAGLETTSAAFCSHGDVIPDILEALLARGMKRRDDLRWQKASTWVLTWDGGKLAKARYLPPPA